MPGVARICCPFQEGIALIVSIYIIYIGKKMKTTKMRTEMVYHGYIAELDGLYDVYIEGLIERRYYKDKHLYLTQIHE